MSQQIENNLAAVAAPFEQGDCPANDFGLAELFFSEPSFEESLGVLPFTLTVESFADDLSRQGRGDPFRSEFPFDSVRAVASAFGARLRPTPGKVFVVDIA
jgi:hypothetical protein